MALAYTGRVEEGIAELREARRIAEEQFDDVDDIARALVNLQPSSTTTVGWTRPPTWPSRA